MDWSSIRQSGAVFPFLLTFPSALYLVGGADGLVLVGAADELDLVGSADELWLVGSADEVVADDLLVGSADEVVADDLLVGSADEVVADEVGLVGPADGLDFVDPLLFPFFVGLTSGTRLSFGGGDLSTSISSSVE